MKYNGLINTTDKFILKAFLKPFFISFVSIHFLWFVQFSFQQIGYMIGKGLDMVVIFKIFVLFLIILIPLVIPLAVLLSSLMTFGSLGEHAEILAIKSLGISLPRLIRPIAFLVIFISVVDFFLNEYLIPYAHLKTWSLLYDIKRKKKKLQFQDGIFYTDIPYYRIRIGHQDPDTKKLNNVMIYDHTGRSGNNKLITAKYGEMEMKEHINTLVMLLDTGYSFVEEKVIDPKVGEKIRFTKSQFNRAKFNFNLDVFDLERTDENLFKGHNIMIGTVDMWKKKDSISTFFDMQQAQFLNDLKNYMNLINTTDTAFVDLGKISENMSTCFYDNENTFSIINRAVEQFPQLESLVNKYQMYRKDSSYQILNIDIDMNLRHASVILILIMFFIGAPLGAIIKKGGLGFPVIVGIFFFIINYVVTTSGRKYAQQGAVDPYMGIWLANIILLVFAVLFMIQAKRDSRLFDIDYYLILLKEWKERVFKKLK